MTTTNITEQQRNGVFLQSQSIREQTFREWLTNKDAILPSVEKIKEIQDKLESHDGDIEVLQRHNHDNQYATKSSEHIHSNKVLLDDITQTKVTEWNNKSNFSGNYNDLSGKPTIPVVDVTKSYVDSALKSKANTSDLHSHDNKTIIDGITQVKITEWNNKSTFSGNFNDLTNKPSIPVVDVTKSYIDGEVTKINGSISNINSSIEDISSGISLIDEDVAFINVKITNINKQINTEYIINAKLGTTTLSPCLCNGTNDDSIQLQAMVDYLSTIGGGIVYIPTGLYTQKSQINWKSNVSLIGDGQGRSILKIVYSGNGSEFGFASIGYDKTQLAQIKQDKMRNCRFENFEIDGSKLTNIKYNSYGKGLYLVYLYNCVIRDVYIHDTSATGLGVDFLCNTIVDNVTVDNCGRLFKTAPLDANRQGGAGIGIGTNRDLKEKFQIINCRANNCGSFGIFVENQKLFDSTQETDSKDIIIANNIVTNNYQHGIGVRACNGVIIANNIIKNSGSDNIFLDNICKNITIDGNIIDGEGNSNNGISLQYYTTWDTSEKIGIIHNVHIKNNSIEKLKLSGILVNVAIINGFTIENNEIKDASLSRSSDDKFIFKGCINFNRINEDLRYDWSNIVIRNNTLLTNFSAEKSTMTSDYGWSIIFISTSNGSSTPTNSIIKGVDVVGNIMRDTMQGVRFSVLSSIGNIDGITISHNILSTSGKSIEIEKYISGLSIASNTFDNCNSLGLADTRCIVAWGGSITNMFINGNVGYSKNMLSLLSSRSNINKTLVCNNAMRLKNATTVEFLETSMTKDCIQQYNTIIN